MVLNSSLDQKTSACGRLRSASIRRTSPVVLPASLSILSATRMPLCFSKDAMTSRANGSSTLV